MRHVIIMSLPLSLWLWVQPFTMSENPMTSAKPPDVEASVCGSFREPFMFWLWHSMAGAANSQGLTNVQGVEPVKFKTRDGITLGGYKLAAENPKAYLLIAQGNAMLADQLVADLQTSVTVARTSIFTITAAMKFHRGRADLRRSSAIMSKSSVI